MFYKVLHDSWGAWKIYPPKNISLKNNSKNDFPKKKLCPSDCVNGKYYLLEWMHVAKHAEYTCSNICRTINDV